MTEWSASEIRQLKRAAAKYPRKIEKNERWRLIAQSVKTHGKRECFAKYKELKNEKFTERNTSGSIRVFDIEASLNLDDGPNLEEKQHVEAKEEKTCVPTMLVEEFKSEMDEFVGSMKVDDFECDFGAERLEVSNSMSGTVPVGEPISLEQAKLVKKLVFADRKPNVFDVSWKNQGFFFQSIQDLKYGLVQVKGGPCGVIAAVQAFVLKALLFGSKKAQNWENPTRREQVDALIDALCTIIWQAGGNRQARLCIHVPDLTGPASCSSRDYRADGVIDKMLVYATTSKAQLSSLVEEHIGLFMQKSGPGTVMLLTSLILSRGGVNIKNDFDSAILGDGISLIGNHNYAGQELVNLMLVGYACSNVFDGTRSLSEDDDSVVLRGIQGQGKVGFLTLFEHYEHVQVGAFLKTPVFPIWVVCSESHYSVLFCDPGCETEDGSIFDVYYYDELGNQEEVYRLSVDPRPEELVECDPDDLALVSPIDKCIRTKWSGASVDWNGSDPLL